MRVVIPTRGRTGRQKTFSFLSPALRKITDIVCPPREYETLRSWRNDVNVVAQPDPDFTITKKRKWICEEWARQGHEKIVMLDDDLEWWTRIAENDWHLRYAKPEDMDHWFTELFDKLGETIPHAGFGARQGNNRQDPVWKTPDRQMYVLGYYLPVVLRECVLGRLENREDMDVTLQLLRRGYPNAVNHQLCAGQALYDMKGGCSDQRTVEQSDADAEELAALHPGLVRVVQKEYGTSKPRKEVVCSWAKALAAGQQWRADQAGSSQVVQ